MGVKLGRFPLKENGGVKFETHNLLLSSYVINIIKSRKMRLALRVGRVRSAVQTKNGVRYLKGRDHSGGGGSAGTLK